MLRITTANSPAEQRWILQGRLVGPWIAELETVWKRRRRFETQRCVVDLTEVTLIDKRGQKMLKTMRRAGAELIARGVYLAHIVSDIKSQCKRASQPRPVPRAKHLRPSTWPAPSAEEHRRSR
jgi:hypothetical protein